MATKVEEKSRHEIRPALVLPPLAVAEVFSGDMLPDERFALGELLQDAPLHVTTLGHCDAAFAHIAQHTPLRVTSAAS
jgi:hypothetical protein